MSLPDISKVFFMDPVARTILPPQLMLTTRSFKPLGLIKYTNWNFSLVANGMDEFTFDVYKPEDITEDMDPKKKLLLTYEKKVWDNLVDLKLILIQDYGRFEISVNYTDNTKTVKSVHAVSLECELSQILLHDFHVNDDEAMATMEANEYNKEDFDYYGNFIPTTLCNFSDERHSLVHRVLADKAPHWTIGNQEEGTGYFTPFVTFDEDEDCELSKEFQRTYTCNGESIYEFLTNTVANEANVVFVFDTINRVINCYSACDCITQHNKELRAAAIGEDTNIFLSKEKLVNEISITSKKDNVKNCFRVEGGDDYINAMVAVANVNGSNYITQFSEFQYDDMSEELKDILGKYEKAIKEAQPEYEKKYLELCTALDDLYDKESGKMPSVSTEDETASDQASVISTKLKTFGTTASYNSESHVGATNGIESLARIYVTSNYDIEIVNGSTSYTKNNNEEDNIDGTWKGTIKITNSTNKEDTTQISATVTVIDDDIRICEQKIEKALAKGDMVNFKFVMDEYLGDDYKITDSERDNIEKYLYDNYCLNRLISFYDAYETCVSTLIDMGKNKSDSAEYNFYLAYVTIRDAIGAAKKKRQSDVDEAKTTVDRLSKECSDFQAQYDMETYLGRQCYLEYCAYRREDTYSNPNYISDGLTDSECIQRAKELLDVARKEIKKACVLQRTLEIDLNNLLMLEEFESFWDKFSMFNYLRLETDDEILKLRLIGLDINGTSLSSVNVTFSDQIENVDGDIDDLQSIMEQAKDMGSSFPSTIRQVKKNEEASAYVGSLRKNGLIAAQTLISNADNNEVTYGGFGILCRNQGDSGDYGEKQLRVIGNGIYLTTDSWKTVEMCIGEISLCNDEGQCTEKYGIIADTIIAGTIIGGDGDNYWNLDTGEFQLSADKTLVGDEKLSTYISATAEGIVVDLSKGVNDYYIRYSENSNGLPMTITPSDQTKYVGIYYGTSAPSDETKYKWQLINNNGEGYTILDKSGIELKDEDGNLEYLHIKYSDDAQTFTINNLLPTDFEDWVSGYYLTGKQTSAQNLSTASMIPVVKGATYVVSGNSNFSYYISKYSSNSTSSYLGAINNTSSTKEFNIPNDTSYIYFALRTSDTSVTYETYQTLFESGELSPKLTLKSESQGEIFGDYIGTYIDSKKQDSAVFNDYTWQHISNQGSIKELSTKIDITAEGIKAEFSKTLEDYDTREVLEGKINASAQGIRSEFTELTGASIYHIRYSENSNGLPMLSEPNEYTKYIGVAKSLSTPSDSKNYSWQLFDNGNNGYTIMDSDGSTLLKDEAGNTLYMHIKYSDDAKDFTIKATNIAPTNFDAWESGYYDSSGKKEDESYIVTSEMIPITPGETYMLCKIDGFYTHYVAYKEDGSRRGVSITDEETDYTVSFSTSSYYVRIAYKAIDTSMTYEKYRELFESGVISPMVYDTSTALEGEKPGDYIGTYVDTKLADSSNFNVYSWTHVSSSSELRELKSYIDVTASGIRTEVSQNYAGKQEFSQLQQTATQLSSKVTTIEKNYVSTSTLQQTSTSIRSEIEKVKEDVDAQIAVAAGCYFHIRYSPNDAADLEELLGWTENQTVPDSYGFSMTKEPIPGTKSIGYKLTGSSIAPSKMQSYSWSSINISNGYLGSLSIAGENGETTTLKKYLHVKFSNDGKTYSNNLVTANINNWASGRVISGSGTTTDFKIEQEGRENCITYEKVIPVTANDKYNIATNHTNMRMYIVAYNSAGDWLSSNTATSASYTYTVPSGASYIVVYMTSTSSSTYSTYEKISSAFDTGEIKPTIYKVNGTLGETLGEFVGTYVDEIQADSENFNSYSWQRVSNDNDIKNMKSLITQTANEIDLCIKSEELDGYEIASRINMCEDTVTIEGKDIHLNGTVISNEAFKVLTDGSALATNMTVENEISTSILNVDTINNGAYQKTLTSNVTLYVGAAASGDIGSPSDDNDCVNNANFETLQGAINSIPKFMNGRTVNIELRKTITENITINYFSSGRLCIYLASNTIKGYIDNYFSSYVNIYGGTIAGGGTNGNPGIIHPAKGVDIGGYPASIGCNGGGYMSLSHLEIYGTYQATNPISVGCQNNGFVYVTSVKVVNTWVGFRANAGGRIHLSSSSGVASAYGAYAITGGYISLHSGTQAGGSTAGSGESHGGTIKKHSPTFESGSVSSSSATTSTQTTKTITCKSTSVKSIRHYGNQTGTAQWRSDSDAKIGEWDDYGYHAAFYFFGDQFEEALAGKITSMKITFSRQSGGNHSSDVRHNFYAHKYESKPSTASPSVSGTLLGYDSIKAGETGTITVSSDGIKNIINNKYKGFCVKAAGTSNGYYSVMGGTVTVKITYTI